MASHRASTGNDGLGNNLIPGLHSAALTPELELHEALAAEEADTPSEPATLKRKRGRKPQDPYQQIIRHSCTDEQQFRDYFRTWLADASHDRNHVLFEASFDASAAFTVDYGTSSGQAKSNSYKYGPAFAPMLGRGQPGHFARSMSVAEALTIKDNNLPERRHKQRAIARAVEHLVETVDGFRYAFHNEWLARDHDAFRFSYFCNDSLLNKDRTLGGSKTKDGAKVKRARKQVYDCQGYLTVKFSFPNQTMEVLYKHVNVHMTYEERAPLPRIGTKRFEVFEAENPDHELVHRARELEKRRRLIAEGGAPPPLAKKARKSAPARAGTNPDTDATCPTEHHSDTGMSANNEARKVASNHSQSEATAHSAGEIAELKAQLAAAQRQIQQLQAQNQAVLAEPAMANLSQPFQQPWYPPYGLSQSSPPQQSHSVRNETSSTSLQRSPSPQSLRAKLDLEAPAQSSPQLDLHQLRGAKRIGDQDDSRATEAPPRKKPRGRTRRTAAADDANADA